MITETGRVVAVEADKVWVQTIRQSACQSCAVRSGCGQRVLAGVSGGKADQVLVNNTLGARLGDEVTLAIAEAALLSASVWVYALPLGLLVAGTALGHWLAPQSEWVAVGGAALGLAAGFAGARVHSHRGGRHYAPELVAVHPPAGATVHPAGG
ncbi:SoxR reducing system RseC family protein [Marinobacter sp. X15-166B]|uniref:SoxR reducing system RseC family protein n=1 Tax=Marinobacter sp. X15-166B TaxID=1897620 RepID=UPI00085CC976|nr:SoxR reducing system RseC family protein [Marinobacter sp. X15-166B]OEY66903.1 sigma E positive regulator RseC/MucC [Marinobacter sp. X15-166B]